MLSFSDSISKLGVALSRGWRDPAKFVLGGDEELRCPEYKFDLQMSYQVKEQV